MRDNWVMLDIVYRDTKQTRTDGCYPHRIGRNYSIERQNLTVGSPAVFYYEDEDMKDFALVTSPTKSIIFKWVGGTERCEVITENSIYTLEKRPWRDGRERRERES